MTAPLHRLEFVVGCDAAVAEALHAWLADVIGDHTGLTLHSADMTPVVEGGLSRRCAFCNQQARGFASINDDAYCHEGASPTCYERASARYLDLDDLFLYLDPAPVTIDAQWRQLIEGYRHTP